MPHSCCSSDMAGTSTPYQRPGQRPPGGSSSHRSHSDHSTDASPEGGPDGHAAARNPLTLNVVSLAPRVSVSFAKLNVSVSGVSKNEVNPVIAARQVPSRDRILPVR